MFSHARNNISIFTKYLAYCTLTTNNYYSWNNGMSLTVKQHCVHTRIHPICIIICFCIWLRERSVLCQCYYRLLCCYWLPVTSLCAWLQPKASCSPKITWSHIHAWVIIATEAWIVRHDDLLPCHNVTKSRLILDISVAGMTIKWQYHIFVLHNYADWGSTGEVVFVKWIIFFIRRFVSWVKENSLLGLSLSILRGSS